MEPRWLAILACLGALIALGHSAALTTPADNLVVSREQEEGITASPTSANEVHKESSVSPTTEAQPTTEEPAPPVKLTEMTVRSEVALRYARTTVITKVRNPAKKAQEAAFRVLLPETAFISGFVMTLDGKSYKAYVKEKEEAKQIYTDAVNSGVGAAHIAAKARDSNHFTVSVNVEANTTAVFNLTYEELLARRNNVYNHAINLHPGALVPKMSVTVHIKEAQAITALRVPDIRTGNEVDATEQDPQNPKAVIERGHDDREATITFTPDLDEQKQLMQVYAEKTKESQSHAHSYLRRQEDESPQRPDGVLGQFVVQYDVARPDNGEVLVSDGYFVHFFAPSDLPPLNKHVVFVLDTSGSMMDRKITQLREAMQTILGELNPGDYFSLVEFSTSVKVYDLKSADREPPKPQYFTWEEKPAVLLPPYPATPDNIARARLIVSRLSANGGTNISGALKVAVDLINRGIDWTPEPTTPKPKRTTETNDPPEALPEPMPVSEGAPTDAQAETTEVTKEATTETAKAAEVTKTNKKGGDAKLQPIIIFLTDGDPTVGETDPVRIINHLTEKNYGPDKAAIFSLAFGEDADRKFLRKLSLRNDGLMRHIYEAADAALQLRDFYRQVSSPLLAHVHFQYPKDQIKEGSLTKNKFRTYYGGSETVVAGRVADGAAELTPAVTGVCGTLDSDHKKFVWKEAVRPAGQYFPLERVWAYLTIKQLLDERDASDHNDTSDDDNSPEKKALQIALKYEFVTPLTSLVVVKPNATNAVDAESVDKMDSPFGVALAASSGSIALPGPPGIAYKAAFQSAVGHLQAPLASYAAPMAVFDAAPAPTFEETDYEESDGTSGLGGPVYFMQSRRSDIVTTPLSWPATTTTPPSLLEPYHLEEFSWVKDALKPGADAIEIDAENNGTKSHVELELTRNTAAPVEASEVECLRATHGAAGVCVYLTRCDAAKHITLDQYKQTYCYVNNKYAGVCCPKDRVDVNPTNP